MPLSHRLKKVTDYDANITAPAKVLAWRTPKMTEQDARVMDFIQALFGQWRECPPLQKNGRGKERSTPIHLLHL